VKYFPGVASTWESLFIAESVDYVLISPIAIFFFFDGAGV
jgi:hypothetical protein